MSSDLETFYQDAFSLEAQNLMKKVDASPISEGDKVFVKFLIDSYPGNFVITNALGELLKTTEYPNVKAKIMERNEIPAVNMMDYFEPFSERQRELITKEIVSVQMTEGCSVGCSFCELMSPRHLTSKFSYESFSRFRKNFGHILPRNLTLYFASDPFDWYDQGRSYLHLWMDFAKSERRALDTSTGIPQGSEISVLRFLFYLGQIGEANNISDELRELFRISKTNINAQAIENIFRILNETTLKREHSDLLVESKDFSLVSKTGYLIKHPQRDLFEDAFPLKGSEGVLLSPEKGLVGYHIEAVTRLNPTGIRYRPIKANSLVLPRNRLTSNFGFGNRDTTPESFQKLFTVLPEIIYDVYDPNIKKRNIIIHSVRRDLVTFQLALSNANWLMKAKEIPEMIEFVQNHPDFMDKRFIQFRQELERRMAICQKNLKNEEDKEAVVIAKELMSRLKAWFVEVDGRPAK